MKRFIARHHPAGPQWSWVKAGVGATLGIGVVGMLGYFSHMPLLIAPFGASSVLLFAVPESALSQPANVVGGHVLATIVSIALRSVLPGDWWAIALAVGVVVAVLAWARLTHPPAGADPIVVFLMHPGWSFVFLPVLLGAVALVLVATIVHMIPPRIIYPAHHLGVAAVETDDGG